MPRQTDTSPQRLPIPSTQPARRGEQPQHPRVAKSVQQTYPPRPRTSRNSEPIDQPERNSDDPRGQPKIESERCRLRVLSLPRGDMQQIRSHRQAERADGKRDEHLVHRMPKELCATFHASSWSNGHAKEAAGGGPHHLRLNRVSRRSQPLQRLVTLLRQAREPLSIRPLSCRRPKRQRLSHCQVVPLGLGRGASAPAGALCPIANDKSAGPRSGATHSAGPHAQRNVRPRG